MLFDINVKAQTWQCQNGESDVQATQARDAKPARNALAMRQNRLSATDRPCAVPTRPRRSCFTPGTCPNTRHGLASLQGKDRLFPALRRATRRIRAPNPHIPPNTRSPHRR